MGEAAQNAKGLEATIGDLALITGQRPVKTWVIPTKRCLAMEQSGNTNFVPSLQITLPKG
ncbi:Ribosomal protein L5, N-terminal [Sesbania bispinosa]|nr:Ribosomal protein L5, N-terminal [Sesbania bispinosa]